MDSFSKIVEIMVTVILLFILPLNYMAIKQDNICQTYVTTETSYLVDSVRNLGYMTEGMYSTFLRKLDETNQIYDITLTHYKQVVYLLPEEEEKKESEFENYYISAGTVDILDYLYEEETERYEFQQGDYFIMEIKNRNKTYAGKIREMLLQRSLSGKEILVVYGGMIRDEAY